MSEVRVPMLFGVRSGHSDLGNIVLPLGVQVTIDCGARELIVEESAVG